MTMRSVIQDQTPKHHHYRNIALLLLGIATFSASIALTFYTSVFDDVVIPILSYCSECITPEFFRTLIFTFETIAIFSSGLTITMSALYFYEKTRQKNRR